MVAKKNEKIAEEVGAAVAGLFLGGKTDDLLDAVDKKRGVTPITKGSKKLAKTEKSDVEVGFIDDIPVVHADGSQGTLGDLDSAPEKPAVLATTGRRSKTASSSIGAVGKVSTPAKTVVPKNKVPGSVNPNTTKQLTAAQQRIAKLEKELAEKKEADKKAAADKRAADKKAADEKKAADKKAKQELAAKNKLIGQGLTGDAEKDAAFERATKKAESVALVTLDTNALARHFLSIPGVKLTPVGLSLPSDLAIDDWADAVKQMYAVQDVTQFAIGDAIIFGSEAYGRQYDVLVKRLGLSPSTLYNYRYVASTIPLDERVEGASWTLHFLASALYKRNPSEALNLLQQAADEGRGKRWLIAELQARTPETADATEKKSAKATKSEALYNLSLAEREADLAAFGGDVEAANNYLEENVQVLVNKAHEDELVSSEATVWVVSRLKARVIELEQEVASLLARLGEREEANARIITAEDEAPAIIEGEATVINPVQDYSFLSALDGTQAAPGTEHDLDAQPQGVWEEGEEEELANSEDDSEE